MPCGRGASAAQLDGVLGTRRGSRGAQGRGPYGSKAASSRCAHSLCTPGRKAEYLEGKREGPCSGSARGGEVLRTLLTLWHC